MASFDFRLRANPIELAAGAPLTVEVAFVSSTFPGSASEYIISWSVDSPLALIGAPSATPPSTATIDTSLCQPGTYQVNCSITRTSSSGGVETVQQSIGVTVSS